MTPEAERSLEKAHECLSTARAELEINLGSEAGRNAYLAALHAARAFIFERTAKAVKRHESVQREFTRLARDEPRIDLPERAAAAIETAARFIDCINRLLAPEIL